MVLCLSACFLDLLLRDSRVPSVGVLLQESQDNMRAFKENIAKAQNQEKQYTNRWRTKRSFEEGDVVFLRSQPYRQPTLRKSGSAKFKPRYYGPIRIVRSIGEMACELELPLDIKVHNVFHASRLKEALGHHVVHSAMSPPLDGEGKLILVLETILEYRERQRHKRTIRAHLSL